MLRRRPPDWYDALRFPRLAKWSARLGVVAFVAALVLVLVGALVYEFQRSVLPASRGGLQAEARNRCAEHHRRGSPPWQRCVEREPTAPAEETYPMVRAAVLAAYAGLVVTGMVVGRRPWVLLLTFAIATATAAAARAYDDGRRDERAALDAILRPRD